MKLFGLCFSATFMICCFCRLPQARGHGVCQGKLIERINITTELKSKILLPCLFDSAPFRSQLTVDSSAVWTQINTTMNYIVEINKSQPQFWNNRNGRIKTFSDHFTSGNFSILIDNVQSSDLSLYRCELYKDSNCSLGYKEINLTLQVNNWQLMVAAGGGGGFLLVCLIVVCVYYTTTRKRQTVDASVEQTSDNCQSTIFFSGQVVDEVTYASIVHKSPHQQESHVLANVSESEDAFSETVLYAAVKKREN